MKNYTEQDFKEFVDRQQWTYAKTYAANSPHEYIVREHFDGSQKDFANAVQFIRDHGFKLMYWKKKYVVYHLEGHFYWTMGEPIPVTRVLNRNDLNDYEVRISFKKRQ